MNGAGAGGPNGGGAGAAIAFVILQQEGPLNRLLYE